MSIDAIRELVLKLHPELEKIEAEAEIGKIPTLVFYCNKCKQEKPSSFFYNKKGKKRYKSQYCRPCNNRWQKRRKVLMLIHPKPDNCESCGLPFQEKGRFRADMDHCHDSDEFRGWLHACCNKGIGQLQNSIEMLEKAIEYLKQRDKFVTLNEVLNRR